MGRALRHGRGFLGALIALLHAANVAAASGAAAWPAVNPAGHRDATRAFPLVAVLCYHDLSEDSSAPLQTVSPEFLRSQIRTCKADGWTFLSLRELLARRAHPESLPARVMVMTFDDGYRSFAERALPILREERVHATLAVITSFVDASPADLPPLMSWDEIRRLDSEGEVEIASHSHALHCYEPDNPYRDTAPATTTRRWLATEKRYEDREQYRSRIGDDLARSQRVLTERLGHPAQVLVWPYGERNEMALALAARAGFSATLGLDGRPVEDADVRAALLPRVMVTRRMDFTDPAHGWLRAPAPVVRAAEIDLDALWDPDESVFRSHLDVAVTRARALGATHVILPVCPDPRGDGRLLRAYAMNHQLPVLADVWSMAAAKFAAARMKVWLRAPSMNLTWAWERHPEWRVAGVPKGAAAVAWGTRLSPDLPEARRAAVDFLTDLAVYLPIEGVLFDDDAILLSGERLAGGAKGATAASAEIRGLIEACKQAVRAWRPNCRFARSVPAETVERAGVDPRFAIAFDDCLAHDDLVFVTVEGWAGGHRASPSTVGRLARRAVERAAAASAPGATAKVVLMLPAYDLRGHRWYGAGTQQAMAAAALRAGLSQLGTGPVAADGEMPIGLLDGLAPAAPVRNAERRY